MSTDGETGYSSRRCSGMRTSHRDSGQRSRYCGYTIGLTIQGSNSGRGKDFSLLLNIQSGSGNHPASISMGTAVFYRG